MGKLKEKWNNISITTKASTAYTVCNILQRCLSFITLPLFTRLLTTTEYGQYTIYSSWMGIIGLLMTLNLQYGSFPTAMTKFEDKRNEYISSIQGIILLLAAIFLVIYIPFSKFWNSLFNLPTIIVIVMVFDIITSTAIQFWMEKQRFEFKYKKVVILTLATAIIAPLVAFLLVINNDSNKGYLRIVGYAGVGIIVGLFIFGLNIYKGKKIFDKEFWKYAFAFNIPLIPYYLSQTVFNQSDRIMIDKMCGTDKAAIYGVAYTLAMVLNMVLNAINASYVPWFYQKIKEGKEEEGRKTANGIALLMAFLLMGVISLAPEIITILAGQQYIEAIWIVPPVAVSLLLLFYSQLFINVEFYYEKKWMLVLASILSAVANIILNWFFIKQFGYIAAGYTTLFSYLLFALCNYFAMKQGVKKQSFSRKAFDYKTLTLIFVGFCILTAIAMALYKVPIARWIIVACVLIGLIIFRKQVTKFVKTTVLNKEQVSKNE